MNTARANLPDLVEDLHGLGWCRFSDDGHANICRYCNAAFPDDPYGHGHESDCLWLTIELLTTAVVPYAQREMRGHARGNTTS